ncbi:hypothetical protein [Dapis sp. BLCC M229]
MKNTSICNFGLHKRSPLADGRKVRQGSAVTHLKFCNRRGGFHAKLMV